ncbi:pyridine nucleotide-disulfide oxidoreductase domain-containing protein 2 isoform X3 [Gossypium hirsutum]|uniref:Pyridine nucleotide-disulfide oxidoreductase domain-containing protein 2 isoform X3 n=1 Tax=Gossypium hirsutum TaxID=3635 RepID=A0ABM2ZS53_GOSHI|nr:pyridine nucleotide-disulfide oxidoreductase domain-containing protein 2-like isoform X3 [Gossypium hirsutum]
MWRSGLNSRSTTTAQALKEKKWDALVIGGGHNGLTAAAYLARGGLSVAVLERRHVIGGAAVTEEIIPGFKFSRCSYLQSLLRPSVIRELELKRHGLKLLKPTATTFTPCLDGRYLLLGHDDERNYLEISKFSKYDADAFQAPETLHWDSSFTYWMRDKLEKSVFWARCLRHIMVLGQKDMVNFMDLLLSPTSKVLNKWFESDILKAVLAGDAIVGSMASIHTPGSGYVLLHHVMGETDGDRNVWSHVEGGMGSVSTAISNAAIEAGASIMTNAEVSQLMIGNSGTIEGVLLADGTRVCSSIVLSNATPHRTFLGLIPRDALPEDFLRAIEKSDYNSGTTKINVAVDKVPWFHCCGSNNTEAGPQHTATIHICSESMDNIGSACQDARNGLPSKRPVMEMTIPSSLDKTISPPGGNIFHGATGLDSLFFMRPAKGWSGYRTPVRGLYLCGSGTHPGGGVMAAPGRNAARITLRDFKKHHSW